MALELIKTPIYTSSFLKAYYPLEGNSTDLKNGYNGTDTAITYGTAYGKFGQGALFNQSTSQITIPTTTIGISGAGARSMGCWFNTADTTSHYDAFLSFAEGGSTNTCFLLSTVDPEATNNIGLHFWGSSLNSGISIGSLGLNTWHWAGATYDGTIASIYVDGILRGSVAKALNTPNSGNFIIGRRAGTSLSYTGNLDDVFIANSCFSPVMMASIFATQIKKFMGVSNIPQFYPTQIGGCKLWIDISQLNLNNNDDVAFAPDLSGNGNNLVQRTVSQNPHFITGAQNGLPVMRHTASASSTWDIPWAYNSPCTFFYVAKLGTTKARLLSGKTNNWLMGVWGGYENQAYYNGWVGANSDVAGTTNAYVWSGITNSTSYLWKNGTLVKSGTGGTTAPAGLTIGYTGASEFSDGDIGEIIGYNRALNDGERRSIEDYLMKKWGI